MKIGTYYYPEQWPREQWARDLENIASMGLKLIHIGEFAWGSIEPSEGRFELDWIDEILTLAKNRKLDVILCTPTAIGEKKAGANNLDAKLDQYSELSRTLAKELDLPLCDLRKAFVDHIATNNPMDADKGILTSDRVHLNKAGNQFVADTMLKTLDP